MSGGIPKRILITQTQRNTPSKAGNPVPKKAIIACSGEKSRTALCNYVRRRTHELPPLQTSYSWSAQMTAAGLSGGGSFHATGFNKFPPTGYIPVPGGMLNPPSTTWTEVLSLVTDPSENFIFRAIGVNIPETITISGGDLLNSYTFAIDSADAFNPQLPATPDLWVWKPPPSSFIFTNGQTYTIFFN